jgi:hypothetical protein
MNNKFIQRKLINHIEDCHRSAMEAISIITDTGISEMNSKGYVMEVDNIQPELIARFAAEKIGISPETLIEAYIDLMVLEKMIVIESKNPLSH